MLLVPQEHKDKQEHKASLESLGRRERKAPQECKEHQVSLV